AADAIARGWRHARPDDELDVLPLADGGEGTLDVLAPADEDAPTSTRRVTRIVAGPRGDPIEATAGVVGATGIVEMARASGLQLLTGAPPAPRRPPTRGPGER